MASFRLKNNRPFHGPSLFTLGTDYTVSDMDMTNAKSSRLYSVVEANDKEELRKILVCYEVDKDMDMFAFLKVKQDMKLPAFKKAVEIGNPDIVRIFIETRHMNINDRINGQTTLMHAVLKHNLSLVKYLLQSNADINARRTGSGQTVLHICAKTDYETSIADLEIFDYILHNGKGIDLEARDNTHSTPLSIASQWVNIWAIRRLLEAGCDMYAIHGQCGRFPIHCAFEKYYWPSFLRSDPFEWFRLFLDIGGLDPNIRDKNGLPLLGHAIKCKSSSILEYLLY